MIKTITFTGTQNGMSERQKESFRLFLRMLPKDIVLIHGDCIGADAEAHKIAHQLGMRIWIYPSNITKKRAYCDGSRVIPPSPPLLRNKRMVIMGDLIIAAPNTLTEQLRSGTWSTIRYARKANKPTIILDP